MQLYALWHRSHAPAHSQPSRFPVPTRAQIAQSPGDHRQIPCAYRQSPTQNCLLPFLRYLQHTGQLEHCLFPSLSVPRHKYAVVLAFLPRFQPFSTQEEGWLLCGSASTSGPTRSGTGHTHALGQGLPRIRTFLDTLVGCPQARLRTFPGNDILDTRGNGIYWIEIGGQESRIQVALHWTNATDALMKPLPEWLLAALPAAVTVLRQFAAVCAD